MPEIADLGRFLIRAQRDAEKSGADPRRPKKRACTPSCCCAPTMPSPTKVLRRGDYVKSLLTLNIFWVPVRSNAPRSFPFLAQLCNILKIDKDYRTYERVIREMKAKEDEMAVTFVDKVSTCVMA